MTIQTCFNLVLGRLTLGPPVAILTGVELTQTADAWMSPSTHPSTDSASLPSDRLDC